MCCNKERIRPESGSMSFSSAISDSWVWCKNELTVDNVCRHLFSVARWIVSCCRNSSIHSSGDCGLFLLTTERLQLNDIWIYIHNVRLRRSTPVLSVIFGNKLMYGKSTDVRTRRSAILLDEGDGDNVGQEGLFSNCLAKCSSVQIFM